uniref:NADH dehydrogenase subunit 6 n=1 Tax=Euurobracon yokahamae TaxID=2911681 RepID=UPI002079895B|nr:NADH dehydrogenase subunit 6 [Euurobracon yokahamae]UJJ81893.1 NADH dehydrogenase subunit 6 [Euurobracon yokahamae]
MIFWMNKFDFFMIYMFMDFILIFMMILPSNLYNFHPLMLGLILIFYIIFITFKMNMILNNYWYSYILFLVMIGGLMILFMYFISLTNNELFYFKLKYNLYQMLKFLMILILIFYMIYNWSMNYIYNLNYFEMISLMNYFEFNYLILLKNLMMDYFLKLNLFMIIYLFFTMVTIVIICNKIKLPLRQMIEY